MGIKMKRPRSPPKVGPGRLLSAPGPAVTLRLLWALLGDVAFSGGTEVALLLRGCLSTGSLS